MGKNNVSTLIKITLFTLTMIAIGKEIQKPKEQRTWHGNVACFPYDFRIPTLEKIRDTFWNPYDSRLIMPTVFGVGWSVNLYALMEALGVAKQKDVSEETFLMPGENMKEVLTHALDTE